MRKTVLMFLSVLLLTSGCSKIKNFKLFGKKDKKESYENILHQDVERLRMAYKDGQSQALEELITIFSDSNQPFDVRIAAGEALADTHHPLALNALAEAVSTAAAIDITLMETSINLLAKFQENPIAAEAMVQALHTIEDRTNSLHLMLVKNLNKVRSKDQVFAMLDLYEAAKANLSRTEKLMTETLGALGDDEVIPILTDIAKDPDVNIAIKNRAVEILGKKEPSEVVGAFTELLGDPQTGEAVQDFALDMMEGVREESLVLSLLDTYNVGKKQYYSLLNTLLDALGDFNDPEVKAAVIEIALNTDYKIALRKKAMAKLGEYGDPSVVDKFLPLLGKAENYYLYEQIMEMIDALGVREETNDKRRHLAYQAQRDLP